MKRALRIFGNRLGNCAYDKIFLKEVKTRPAGSTNNLMRAANYPAAKPTTVPAPISVSHVTINSKPIAPSPLQPPSTHLQPQQEEIIFDDGAFDNSMMISEEDLVIDESAFLANENVNNVAVANATTSFPSAGIYPLPPRPTTK